MTDLYDENDLIHVSLVTSCSWLQYLLLFLLKICGAIIGRSGVHLQQVRLESGAKISLSDDFMPHSQNRLITVTGTEEEVDNARLLLQMW